MLLFKKVKDLQQYLLLFRKKNRTIGFVPTMGALHRGHLSLIKKAKKESDVVVCSIFVNPTQFNDDSDLDKYPRTAGKDIELLTSEQTNVLFMPPVEEVYPKGLDTSLKLDFGGIETVLEGKFRPGHFDGMAQVVKRLLDIVQPDSLFMGQKDFQQLTIVRSMLTQLSIKTDLVMCPIIRENDGLAMSSRNVRLTPKNRKLSVKLSKTLNEAKKLMVAKSPKEIQISSMKKLSIPEFKPEYFEIVDGITLLPVENFVENDFVVACTAVWVGDVRLIDNVILKP